MQFIGTVVVELHRQVAVGEAAGALREVMHAVDDRIIGTDAEVTDNQHDRDGQAHLEIEHLLGVALALLQLLFELRDQGVVHDLVPQIDQLSGLVKVSLRVGGEFFAQDVLANEGEQFFRTLGEFLGRAGQRPLQLRRIAEYLFHVDVLRPQQSAHYRQL